MQVLKDHNKQSKYNIIYLFYIRPAVIEINALFKDKKVDEHDGR